MDPCGCLFSFQVFRLSNTGEKLKHVLHSNVNYFKHSVVYYDNKNFCVHICEEKLKFRVFK